MSSNFKTPGYIYAIGIEGHPYVKIGQTIDVRTRLDVLQCASPFALHLIATVYVSDWIRYIERHIHKALAPYRHRREWFLIDMNIYKLERLVTTSFLHAIPDGQRVQALRLGSHEPKIPRRKDTPTEIQMPASMVDPFHSMHIEFDMDLELA